MENAGGSQAPASVSDAVRQHMRRSFCQLGAGYPASDRAVAVVDSAHAVLKTIMGVEPTPFGTGGEVILGGSSTQLLTTLAACFRDSDFLLPGDDVVIHRASHEANVGSVGSPRRTKRRHRAMVGISHGRSGRRRPGFARRAPRGAHPSHEDRRRVPRE